MNVFDDLPPQPGCKGKTFLAQKPNGSGKPFGENGAGHWDENKL